MVRPTRAICIAALWCGGLPSEARAALPPQYQRAVEIKAVVEEVSGKRLDPVIAVEYVSPDLFRVRTTRCVLEVAILDLASPASRAPGWVGPREIRAAIKAERCD